MRLEERYKGILQWFEENVPQPQTELNYRNPYELLVAVILSAQCTDKRVNMVTPAFFELYPTPEVLAVASVEAVFDSIKSVSYPNNKAKHLVGMAQVLVNEFNGIVPDTVEQLEKMPGAERTLVKHIPQAMIPKAHHWLILHGRYVCLARKPKCAQCGLQPWCRWYEKHPLEY